MISIFYLHPHLAGEEFLHEGLLLDTDCTVTSFQNIDLMLGSIQYRNDFILFIKVRNSDLKLTQLTLRHMNKSCRTMCLFLDL